MAQVGIGTSMPDSSARLQIDANAATNAKGFLLPRVTAAQKVGIVSPATGLIVYQTDGTQGFYYYNGSSWNLLPSASNAVPYSGATGAVNLGAYDLTVNGLTVGRGSGNASSNTASGYQALYSNNAMGNSNTASGYQTLYSNTIGFHNTASGYRALYSNIQGCYNTASGSQALYSNTTGGSNTAFGYSALYRNNGSNNSAIGFEALRNNMSSNNVALGYRSLYYTEYGGDNVAIGSEALYNNRDASYSIAIGTRALLSFNQSGSSFNTAIGYYSQSSNQYGLHNVAVGYYSLNSLFYGSYNVGFGNNALRMNSGGNYNTAIGHNSLYSNVADANTAIGYHSLYWNTSGTNNTALGYNALNTGIYFTGSNCTVIGSSAQTSTNSISNEITLGNSSVTSLRCNATSITSLSDKRDKTDIIPIVEGLAFLKQLNPVSFTWNTRDKAKVGIKSAGFIAQELLALQKQSNIGDNLDLVSENNPEKLEARYGNLLPVIVKAIQEENAEKDKEIKALKERLNALEKQINQILNKK